MLNMNRVTLLGHAGRDPGSRQLNDDERTAFFSLATTRRWKGEGGATVEKTDWHRIVVYGGAVKPVEDLVRKGSLVLVEGRLATREYDDSKGIGRQVTEVVVAGPQGLVNVLSRKPSGDDTDGGGDTPAEEPAGDAGAEDTGADDGDGDGAGDEDV